MAIRSRVGLSALNAQQLPDPPRRTPAPGMVGYFPSGGLPAMPGPPPAPPAPPPYRFVGFGDSYTEGVGGTPGNDYPAQLAAQLPAEWTEHDREGFSGHSMEALLAIQNSTLVHLYNPAFGRNVLLLWESLNSFLARGDTYQEALQATRAAVQKAVAYGYEVWLLDGIDQDEATVGAGWPAYWAGYKAGCTVAAMGCVGVIRLSDIATINDPNNLATRDPDKIHLNDAGYGIVAAAVAARIAGNQPQLVPPFVSALAPPPPVNGTDPRSWWSLNDVPGDGEDGNLAGHNLTQTGTINSGNLPLGPAADFVASGHGLAFETTTAVDPRLGFEICIRGRWANHSGFQGIAGQFESNGNWLLYAGNGVINFAIKNDSGTVFNLVDSEHGAVANGEDFWIRAYWDPALNELSVAVSDSGFNAPLATTGPMKNALDVFHLASYQGAQWFDGLLQYCVFQQGAQGATWRAAALDWLKGT